MKGVVVRTNIKYETPDIEVTRFESDTNIMDTTDNENFGGDDVHRGGSDQDVTTPANIIDW